MEKEDGMKERQRTDVLDVLHFTLYKPEETFRNKLFYCERKDCFGGII